MRRSYSEVTEHLLEVQYTWLITGVAGFIGSNLLETLLNCNQKVIGLDNYETGFKENIEGALHDSAIFLEKNGRDACAKNFTFHEGSILDLELCRELTKKTDFVLHQAALGSVPRSLKDPIASNRANIDGCLNMLVASNENHVKRFIFAASSSTYGDHPDLPKKENIIGSPLSPYAVTKLVNELYAEVFYKCYGLEYIGLRYFNVFGKRQNPNGAYAAVIPKWIGAMIDNNDIYINGDGETSRDFCYVDNVVQMNLLSALSEDPHSLNQIYNVALNDRTSLNQLFKYLGDELRSLHPNLKINPAIYRDFRPGDVLHSMADISKANKYLNYQPSHKVLEGIKEAMYWYASNLGSYPKL
jgi:UDP-N-acetylglucosamine/UDP-N-acetylgalactosamine 4-epimerase